MNKNIIIVFFGIFFITSCVNSSLQPDVVSRLDAQKQQYVVFGTISDVTKVTIEGDREVGAAAGLAIGGAVVDGGRFDWAASGKFPTLSEPYDGYHGIVFTDEFGPQALSMRARSEGLKDFGACMSPANAFYILQGIETLPLRMQKHVSNTHSVIDLLDKHDAVEWIRHPDHPSHPDHELAKRLYTKGSGAILSFGIAGGREAGRKFIESVELASHLANVGDAKTLVIHPASTTHQQMSAEDLSAAGIGEDLVRVSVGLEDPDDICADLDRALKASQR